jgi:hypothetical protein
VTEPVPKGVNSVPCTVDGCDHRPKARGLCEKHYRRHLRTGDPNHTRKPGPTGEASAARKAVRLLLSDYSDRKFSRYWTAMGILTDIGRATGNTDLVFDAIRAATRPCGSVNTSALSRRAEQEIMRHIDLFTD